VPSSFEELVFSIIATDKGASAAFDRFRGKVDETSRSVDDNSKSLDRNAKSVEGLAESLGSAANLGAFSPSGMGALIGASVALAPYLTTIGFGLAGFGLAAVGVAKPVLDAAQKTGGLAKNMAALDPEQKRLAQSLLGLGKQYSVFEKSLQPQVLSVFGKGIVLAGHLMSDLQPIAKNTGIALGQVLGRIDAEFKSGTWRDFFAWMASQVGPDLNLVGDAFVHLLDTLPPLLKLLNPVSTDFLSIVDAGTKLIGKAAEVGNASTRPASTWCPGADQDGAGWRCSPRGGPYHALDLIGFISHSTGDATQALANRLKAPRTGDGRPDPPDRHVQRGRQRAHGHHEQGRPRSTPEAVVGVAHAQQDQGVVAAGAAGATRRQANSGSPDSNRSAALTPRGDHPVHRRR
jgi:hypothetical protein